MENSLTKSLHTFWMLIRFIAVVSSSLVVILSSLLPLFLYSPISTFDLFYLFVFLCVGAITIHGVLVHLFNDYADHLTGTDANSPAVLSGGSRVIQNGLLHPETVWKIGKWLTTLLLLIAVSFALIGRYEVSLLLIVGVWSTISYSLPPLRLSYRPFLGEVFSLFPAIFFLGIAGPWLILDSIPLWAYQHAIINAFICMGWVMVHHIPDIEADKQAVPKKSTTVVWIVNKFGSHFAFLPAFLYFFLAGLGALWISFDRFVTGVIAMILIGIALVFIAKINPKDLDQVTTCEKLLLLLAIIIGIVLGVVAI